MFAKLTIHTHRASTRVIQLFVFNPQPDAIRPSSLHLRRDRSLFFGYRFDLSTGEVVIAAFKGSRACHAAESTAFE